MQAQQIDIPGLADSTAFGTAVAVLPNGNLVITDPYGVASGFGRVYLYGPAGNLITFFTGSTANDNVGSGGITVLANGNFVISSPSWNNGAATNAGAVTWVDGNTGAPVAFATVSPANSLVGTSINDRVGASIHNVTALANGNFVVSSPLWNNGAATTAGAVTWVNGAIGLSGAVSPGNSLVGSAAGDEVGFYVVTLTNGNYVVASPYWDSALTDVGAATWASGSTGLSGAVATSNSLVGSAANDQVGLSGVTALENGNYVVGSLAWAGGAGAATWGDGSIGLVAAVSVANSLVGALSGDSVGSRITALTNGNYVVASPEWANAGAMQAGAVTWADGTTGRAGSISIANSLVGSLAFDRIGFPGVTALANGNYVVASAIRNGAVDGTQPQAGAATWGNGAIGVTGLVSSGNSVVGSVLGDRVGFGGAVALANGNCVVVSPYWHKGAIADVGAITWINGSTGLSGTVATSNSLVGAVGNDRVGDNGVTALANGNYVIASPDWASGQGAATWANGAAALVGDVSPANSLIGNVPGDYVGIGVTALTNGNYVVRNPVWKNGAATSAGAATLGNGRRGLTGTVSTANSLVGSTVDDRVGDVAFAMSMERGVTALPNGDYVVQTVAWDNGLMNAGAVSIGRGKGGTVGPILAMNSVRGTVANAGVRMVYAYDASRDTLIVGQPGANRVSLFKADLLFANGFE